MYMSGRLLTDDTRAQREREEAYIYMYMSGRPLSHPMFPMHGHTRVMASHHIPTHDVHLILSHLILSYLILSYRMHA